MNYPKPIWLKETTSTNTYLNEWCNEHPEAEELTCVYTSYQSAGRGQRGNSWESEAGANLLFSFMLRPEFLALSHQFRLSQITALALQEVLSEYTDHICIKWPNDIYWKDCKLCGTLIENELIGGCISRSISGTGVNVNQKVFVSDAPNPVSLYQITGKEYSCNTLLQKIMERTARYYEMLRHGNEDTIATRYHQALYRKDGFYPYQDRDGVFLARIVQVQPSGGLILEREDGTLNCYMFKEVSFIIA